MPRLLAARSILSQTSSALSSSAHLLRCARSARLRRGRDPSGYGMVGYPSKTALKDLVIYTSARCASFAEQPVLLADENSVHWLPKISAEYTISRRKICGT